MMLMLQELSDLKGLTTAQVIGLVVIVMIIGAVWMELAGDGVSNILHALRGPKQIISHNICPKCQKVQTQEIDPD
jgi:hypothetical protein